MSRNVGESQRDGDGGRPFAQRKTPDQTLLLRPIRTQLAASAPSALLTAPAIGRSAPGGGGPGGGCRSPTARTPLLARRDRPQLLRDQTRRAIGKSQPMWTDAKMKSPRLPSTASSAPWGWAVSGVDGGSPSCAPHGE
eukprot:COSAG01_NODE_6731_length_3524_cov_10.057963_4_plen_138_part_00